MTWNTKPLAKSQYKYVSHVECNGVEYFKLNMKGYGKKCYFTEREAAIAIDKILIGQGKEPVNILKKL